MSQPSTESFVQQVALTWLESLGHTLKHGLEIGPVDIAVVQIIGRFV